MFLYILYFFFFMRKHSVFILSFIFICFNTFNLGILLVMFSVSSAIPSLLLLLETCLLYLLRPLSSIPSAIPATWTVWAVPGPAIAPLNDHDQSPDEVHDRKSPIEVAGFPHHQSQRRTLMTMRLQTPQTLPSSSKVLWFGTLPAGSGRQARAVSPGPWLHAGIVQRIDSSAKGTDP